MAFASMDSRQRGAEMLQKGHLQPVFSRASMVSTTMSDTSDVETEFEDDMSDFEDYAGRRSEDSYGKRSDTTVSTFEELRTPSLNGFKSFNFQLPEDSLATESRKIVGPSGPHLFRYSLESNSEQQVSIQWSPIDSPHGREPPVRALEGPQRSIASPPANNIPLECWSPPQVSGWVRAKGLDETLVQSLLKNDISGAILKELKFGDLKELGIDSFGQRHQLWDEIRRLRGSVVVSPAVAAELLSPIKQFESPEPAYRQQAAPCSSPPSPEDDDSRPTLSRRRARRALRPDDVISPAESASIVAIEQLLPKPHHCSKGENCSKWRKQQKQLARIAKEFPLELEQIGQDNDSTSDLTYRPASEAEPSVVASSDLLGPGLPSLRLDEQMLRIVPPRDPQENVRHFLDFQHINSPDEESSGSSPYEMFPPLSPPGTTQAPHSNLSRLPKLTIPAESQEDTEHTVIHQVRSPITAVRDLPQRSHDWYAIASPASTMDMPMTAIPTGPIARDESQSVPPNMQYGSMGASISRSQSRTGYNPWEPVSPVQRPQTASGSRPRGVICPSPQIRQPPGSHRPSFAMATLRETTQRESGSGQDGIDGGQTPTVRPTDGPTMAGWMKKRKNKMLRHEWHENHFRLQGTTLAMHRNSKALDALEYIDVDDFAVACSSMASNNKFGAALKSFKITSGANKKREAATAEDVNNGAFYFQLVPSNANHEGSKAGMLAAAKANMGSKTHHFAVKNRDDRIDWMRELMLAKALKEKGRGCEVNVNGNAV